MDPEMLRSAALAAGFTHAALVDTAQIPFNPAFRKYCEDNLCGNYNANYSCPPVCGTCEQMEARVRSHHKALLVESVWEIPDWRDWAAVRHAKNTHNRQSAALKEALGLSGFIIGASACGLCETCAIAEGLPCRIPAQQYSCMSAYCIYVKGLCDLTGLPYDCGPGRIGFFGLLVFDPE